MNSAQPTKVKAYRVAQGTNRRNDGPQNGPDSISLFSVRARSRDEAIQAAARALSTRKRG